MLTHTSADRQTNVTTAAGVGGLPTATKPGLRVFPPHPAGGDDSLQHSVDDLHAFLDSALPDSIPLVGRSPAMLRVVAQALRFAKSSAAVLIVGESGTGKELIARLLHESGPRADHPYVRVNCAALSEGLIESELFGHVRGAFTGAAETRIGRFEAADGGTLLLDEISEIPATLQAKLLRVLEEDEFQRVGANTTCQSNARVISTTNRVLESEVAARTFRMDLFHRLNVLRLDVPPLRSRREDIPDLVEFFLKRFAAEAVRPIRGISNECLDVLTRCDWPGNVRQVRNVIHHACVVNSTGIIEPCDLPELAPAVNSVEGEPWSEMRLDEIERQVILACLDRYNGNNTAAAKHLGVTARTLHNKLKRYRSEARNSGR